MWRRQPAFRYVAGTVAVAVVVAASAAAASDVAGSSTSHLSP